MTSRRRTSRFTLALVVAAGLVLAPGAGAATVGVGVADGPGGAKSVAARGKVTHRYQYLAGGVDAPNAWSSWNPDGTFVSRYVRESHAAGVTPVLTYYTLLQSGPDTGLSEAEKDLQSLADPALMRRWYADLRLALTRARQAARGRRVIVHVEPDLWGYVQQRSRGDDARTVPAAVASSGDPELAGLPDTAAGVAQAVVRLRDRHAPKVRIAWHLSTWGTNDGTTHDDPPRSRIDALARRSARFARSLGARFDLIFNDVADRDDGFRQVVLRERPVVHHWGAGDAARHLRWVRGVTRATRTPMVLWQLPLGHRGLPNTWRRFRDNRVDLLIGSSRAVRRVRAAGVVALLFGGGADGCTTARTDGGHFFRHARRVARGVRGSSR